MKTTIYELLGMIKDNKAPKLILFKDRQWKYDEKEKDYVNIFNEWLFDSHVISNIVNCEVEILETTIYKQDDYIQYQPYTGEVEIKCNSPKNILESDKIEKLIVPNPREWFNYANLQDVKMEIRGIDMKINEIIDYINSTK